jgi:nitroreductase
MSAPSAGNEQPWHFIVIFKKLFSLPEDVIPFALIPLGYPDQAYRREDRFNPERLYVAVW